MDTRTAIFYLALLLIVGGVAELYVRMNRIGESAQKVHGVLVSRKPRLGPPLVFLIVAIIVAAVTIPN